MARANIQGMQAEANTVAAFERVNARFGGRLRITYPYGAGRTHAQQAKLHSDFLAGHGNYAAPAGQSNHEFDVTGGTALDISNWASFPGLRAAMKAENFTRDPDENWHYNYRGTTTAGGNATPIPNQADEIETDLETEEEDEDMDTRRLYAITDGHNRLGGGANRKFWYLMDETGWERIVTPAIANYWSVRLPGKAESPNVAYEEIEAACARLGIPHDQLWAPTVAYQNSPA